MPEEQNPDNDGTLERTAKALGAAAGKIARLAGVAAAPEAKSKQRLQKRNKTRLPRRLKKAQKKAVDQS